MGYAVIDLETTGFSPARGDRIVEVGVVLVDDSGLIESEWSTLVNPQRDVGATHVHGIRASDVVDAPLFGEVARHLVNLLHGRSLVAHNQEFDLRFLRAELAAHGYPLDPAYAALCTMLWSRSTFGAAKLRDVCDALGIRQDDAHAALSDARATAKVLAALIASVGPTSGWRDNVAGSQFAAGTPAAVSAPEIARRPDRRTAPMVFVDTAALPLWERITIHLDYNDAAAAVYLDMLTRVLEDGLISTAEYSRLDAIAEVAHLTPERIATLHRAYLAAAVEEATADGVLSADERRELDQIATILDLPVPEIVLDVVAAEPFVRARSAASSVAPTATGAVFTLVSGARIVFTGTLSRPRDEWARAIADAGFVTGSVTKNCVVLIAEDPASQSGKAKTARAHGIPIVTEAEFIPVFDAFIAR